MEVQVQKEAIDSDGELMPNQSQQQEIKKKNGRSRLNPHEDAKEAYRKQLFWQQPEDNSDYKPSVDVNTMRKWSEKK